MRLTRKQLYSRARKVKLLLLDVDGVLTDGRIYYLPNPRGGFFETKTFHSRDGLGIRMAHAAGIKTGIITGRGSPVIVHRVKELGIHFLHQNIYDKIRAYEEICRAAGVSDDQVAYIGDDIVDLPVLERVGLAVCVSDGDPTLRKKVHYRTSTRGGLGAVREAIELILAARGITPLSALRRVMRAG
jgi:3-deoxy-D-manno-octulosonate 8-phosphate phosphatase (KDO 8-P phosphatase)